MNFLVGVGCVFQGVRRLVTTPELWGWALAPVVVTFAFLAAAGALGHDLVHDRLVRWCEEQFGGSAIAGAALSVAFWVVFAVVLFFAFSACVRVIAAPFLVLLADRTVAEVTGAPAPAAPGGRLVRWVLRPLWEAVVLFGIRTLVTVVALPLVFVPVVGALLFAGVMMWTLGVDLVDIAQSARGIVLGARLRFIGRHLVACLGLGLGAGLLLVVPCVNVLLLPAIVVAGVLLDSRIAPDFPKAATA